MHKYLLASLFFLFLTGLVSCTLQVGHKKETKPSAHSSAVNVDASEESNALSLRPGEIGPGDVLSIKVYGEASLSGKYQVGPSGYIVFPLIGKISAVGYNIVSLSEKISEKLSDGYVKNPQVILNIISFVSNRIYVLGQVKKAGKFPMLDKMSVVEAISLAGGFTRYADITRVIITRKSEAGKEKRYNIDIEKIVKGKQQNFYLQTGDIVFVTERFF
ncbi:polysaccharide export protein [bacterium]|nr:polysaccharide export protein [bacterium]